MILVSSSCSEHYTAVQQAQTAWAQIQNFINSVSSCNLRQEDFIYTVLNQINYYVTSYILKPSQNKNVQKFSICTVFWNPFLQLETLGPCYFDPTLE